MLLSRAPRKRSACLAGGYDKAQAPPAMNYHRAHPEHVTKVAGNPCHAAGGHNGYNSNSNNHGGASHHRYETYEETCEEKTTYSHQGHGYGGGGARRYEYETYEETCYEEEQEVVGGGGSAQLKSGYRCA